MEAAEAATLLALEVQTWLEFDAFLRSLAATRADGALPAPAQLLSLLPPPPEPAGWPEEFILQQVVVQLRQKAAAERSKPRSQTAYDPQPYVPYAREIYPARRRAQRLSFSIWTLIRQENADLQQVLETASTSDRLRLAVRRLRELREDLTLN